MKMKFLRTLVWMLMVTALISTAMVPAVSAAAPSDDPQPTVTGNDADTAATETATSTPEIVDFESTDETIQEAIIPLSGGAQLFLPVINKPGSTSKLLNVLKVEAGNGFACALMSNHGVKCWGNNQSGQLGNGSNIDDLYPEYVTGLTSNVQDIAVGYDFACALTLDGDVKCWGENNDGQLGNGAGADEALPIFVQTLPLHNQSITAGWYHACVVTEAGGVMCWGKNNVGQLGNNDKGQTRVTPVGVYNLTSGVQSIAAGGYHTCAINYKAEVQCWGYNATGQLGDNSTTNRLVPTTAYDLSSVAEISAGNYHTCVVTNGGSARCWGWNYYGQIGNNSTSDVHSQVKVYGMSSGELHISTGNDFTCAISEMNEAECWGLNNYGQLGNNSTTNSKVPVSVTNLSGTANSVAAGVDFACAVTTEGGIKCWGHNNYGQLGNQTTTDSHVPVDVMALED